MREHHRDRERGATLVEAAIVTPLFFLFIFAVIEFGSAYSDNLTVTNMTNAGARTASTSANDGYADWDILQAVKKNAAASGINNIQRVVIYKANPASANSSAFNNPPTTQCQTASVAGLCNSYSTSDLSQPQSKFGCGTGSLDLSWCPTTRAVNQTAANGGPPDYIGVWVQLQHNYYTRFFGTSVSLTGYTVIQIEPRQL